LVGVWYLTPLSTIFQLHRDSRFYWLSKIAVPSENYQPAAVTDKQRVPSNNKTDRDYITEILLKVTLNAITLTAFACVEVNVYFVLDKHFKCVLIVLAHCNNNLQTDTLS
jgi:hypothetical protein